MVCVIFWSSFGNYVNTQIVPLIQKGTDVFEDFLELDGLFLIAYSINLKKKRILLVKLLFNLFFVGENWSENFWLSQIRCGVSGKKKIIKLKSQTIQTEHQKKISHASIFYYEHLRRLA